MYRAISQKTVCCDSNEELLHPAYGRLYYRGFFSSLVYMENLYCIV